MPPTFDQSDPVTCGDVVGGIIEMTDDPDTRIVFLYEGVYFVPTSMTQDAPNADTPIIVHLDPN